MRRVLLLTLGALAVVVGVFTACGDTSHEGPPPDYEREDGPRVPRAELREMLEYAHSISANICYPGASGSRPDRRSAQRTRRRARRELRLLTRLARTRPDHLLKTKVAYSDYGDVGRDVTVREYAENAAERLRGHNYRRSKRARECVARTSAELERIARMPDPEHGRE